MSLSLVAAALSMTAVQAPDTAVHVTYTTKAASLSRVLSDLSGLSKVQLEPTTQAEGEILLVSVKDVPLSDVMARIATVTSCEWRQEGSTYRLAASAAIRRKEERDEETLRVASMKKSLDKRVQALKAQENPPAKGATAAKTDPATQFQTALATSSPENAAITKLLAGVDPAALADLGPQERAVFSTAPTQTQRPLPDGAIGIINDFIQKHNSQVKDQNEDAGATGGLSVEQAEALKAFTKGRNAKIGPVAKALLVASHMGFGVVDMTQLELRLYDQKGNSIYSGQDMLMPDMDLSDVMKVANLAQGKNPQTTTSKETPIEYSDDSKAFQQATKGMTTGSFKLRLSSDLKAKIFTPSAYDPLSFMVSDELLSYAKSKGKSIVADIPDSAEGGLASYIGGGGTTVEAFGKSLNEGGTMKATADDRFITVKPTYPSAAREGRLDRGALTALMQATEAKGIPSLDDLSEYATHAPDPLKGGIGQLYLTLFVPGAIQQSMDGLTDWEMLRFYGRLSPDMRASLGKGGSISISNFSAAQKASLEKMTYGSLSQLSVEDPQHPSDSEQTPFWMKMVGGSSGGDYRTEPTEVVPNGLPGDGYVDLKIHSESFAAPVADADSTTLASVGVLGADELAVFKMFKEDKNYASLAGMLPSFPQLRIGQRSVLAFTFHLSQTVTVRQTLRDHKISKDSPIVSENNLPSDLQKQVDDKLAMIKKSPLGALGALMGGGRQQIHP